MNPKAGLHQYTRDGNQVDGNKPISLISSSLSISSSHDFLHAVLLLFLFLLFLQQQRCHDFPKWYEPQMETIQRTGFNNNNESILFTYKKWICTLILIHIACYELFSQLFLVPYKLLKLPFLFNFIYIYI